MKLKLKSILRLALPYILMAMLPIVSVIFLSGVIVRNHTNEILHNQNNAIEIAAERVNEKISAVEERAVMITNNGDIVRYMVYSLTGQEIDIISCQKIQSFLSIVSDHPEIAQIYFYDGVENRVIATDTVLFDSNTFFDYLYRYQERSTDEVLNELRSEHWRYEYRPVGPVEINGRSEYVIEYRISIPANRQQQHSQLVIALDVDALFRDYFDVLNDGAEFRVYYDDQLVCSSSDNFGHLEQAKLTDSLTLLEDTEEPVYAMERSFHDGFWRVRFYYPKLPNIDNGRALNAYLLPAVTIPVIVCVVMCIYFTHINRRQILELLSLLRGKCTEEKDLMETEYISHKLLLSYAGDLAEKFAAYEDRLHEVHATEKNTVLERLVRNAYRTEAEKQRAIGRLSVPVADGACAVICIQFDDAGSAHMIAQDISPRDVIADLLETHVGLPMEVFDNLSNEVVCIISADESFEEVADNTVSLLNVHINTATALICM